MNCFKLFFAVSIIIGLSAIALVAAPPDSQPVLILLYSRFDDHVMMSVGEDRIFRLLNLLEALRKEFPQARAAASIEFSGAFAGRMPDTPTGKEFIERLLQTAKAGAVNFGYSGEHEPTYRNRPKAVLTREMTPEQRWTAQTNAAERFLNDFKDPLTGQPDPARAGGLRRMREVFGDPLILGLFAPQLGGEMPYYHQLRRMKISAIVPGFPDPYFTMNIHGYRISAETIGKAMSPEPQACSELFWDNNLLRASFTSSADVRGFPAEEGKEALGKLLKGLDRSRVRLLQIEVAGYARYLNKWPDGTPKLHPLTWAYDHPDEPAVPGGIRAFVDTKEIQKAYDAEEEALRWLLGEFLPANPGSRVVTPQDLAKMASTPVESDVSAETLAEAARDWLARTGKEINMPATYAKAGAGYYSAADLFQLLSGSLAKMTAEWKRPAKVHLSHIYGPIILENTSESFPDVTFSARAVAEAAARLAPQLSDQTWRPVPANSVPARVEIGGKRVIPSQFLAMMVDAYLAASPGESVKLRYFQPITAPGYFFPRQNSVMEAGNTWTLRPAPLNLNMP